jgi:hypothetical protein
MCWFYELSTLKNEITFKKITFKTEKTTNIEIEILLNISIFVMKLKSKQN